MKILRWSLLMTLSLVLTVSCTDDTAEVKPLSSEFIQVPESILMDQELEQTANLLANFIDEKQVTAELFTYATEESDGEVYAAFKNLFDEEEINNGRKNGFFASRFRSTIELANGRSKSTVQLEELKKKLGNGYALYAPYLFERFSDSKRPITVSWYNGQDTSGVTPGIISTKNGRTSKSRYVDVTDEYASKNPTVVIVPLEPTINSMEMDDIEEGDGGGGSGGGGSGGTTATNLSCTIQNVELLMPKYILHDHVRPWPNRNLLYLWAATGDYTISSDGSVVTSVNAPKLWHQKKVSRNNVGKWLNSDITFLKNNWRSDQVEVQLVFGYYKLISSGGINFNGNVGVKPNNLGISYGAEFNITMNNAILMETPLFDRCATLSRQADASIDGLKDGYRVYRFGKMEFYLKGEPF